LTAILTWGIAPRPPQRAEDVAAQAEIGVSVVLQRERSQSRRLSVHELMKPLDLLDLESAMPCSIIEALVHLMDQRPRPVEADDLTGIWIARDLAQEIPKLRNRLRTEAAGDSITKCTDLCFL